MPRTAAASCLNDLVANCVTDQIADRSEAKFAHDIRAMGLDSLDAHAQCRGGFLVAPPLGQQLNDLALPWGHTSAVHDVLCAMNVVIQNELGDGRRQKGFVVAQALNGCD